VLDVRGRAVAERRAARFATGQHIRDAAVRRYWLLLLVPTTTFAAFDWGMSLEPTWFSSIYGAILTGSGVVTAHALAIVGAVKSFGDRGTIKLPAGDSTIESVPAAEVLGDLGNLLLAFVMLWAYFSFSQFLLIWSGNLPHEITWYERRLNGGWAALALAVVMLQFALPFVLLFSRGVKRSRLYLSRVGWLLVLAYGVNMYWTVVPAFGDADASRLVLNAAAMSAVGGIWLALFGWLSERALSTKGRS
jgi:hypothetical protein